MRGIVVVLFLAGCGAQSSFGYLQPPMASDHSVGLGNVLDSSLGYAVSAKYLSESVSPPLSLTPTDGSELALERLAATASISGPVAHTELQLTFHNAESRIREGRFELTLPAGAAITRFAMKINGEWRESRVVARQRGREVFETYLHVIKTDPALLEQDLGNRFSTRIYPILGLEDKELIVEYDSEVTAERGYTLALRGLSQVGELQVTVDNNGERKTTAEHDAIPDDVHVNLVSGNLAVASGESFVARVDAGLAVGDDASVDRVLYLVDTSASRANVMGKQIRILEALLDLHPSNSFVSITTFDQSVGELYRGPVGGAKDAMSYLVQHGALGSSNLGAALQRAAVSGMSRVVIIGDGVATAGEHDVAKLSSIVSGSRLERVDVVQVGQSLDRTSMQRIVRSGRTPGAILDGANPEQTMRQLRTTLTTPVEVSVDGATGVWPKTTRHVAPGEPVFVYGMRAGSDSDPLVIHVGKQTITMTPRKGHDRLRRTVARAELADLVEQLQGAKDDVATTLGDQIEKLALEHSLVSPRTSLIVLESEWDEQRFLGPRQPNGGTTIDAEYIRNIPVPGRTFESALGAAAGSQTDSLGVSFSGTTSLENQYYVDGVNTTGLTFGASAAELCIITTPSTRPRVRGDVMSPLLLDTQAELMRRDPFFMRDLPYHESTDTYVYVPTYAKPYAGKYAQVMSSIARHKADALDTATRWQLENPGDVTAILALGEALEARGAADLAARAYGSIADMYPNRAELLRVAAERLDRIPSASNLAIDFYRRALRERPDQVTTYRLLAWTLFRANRAGEALDVLLEGMHRIPRASIQNILAEDAGIIGANIVAREPARRYEIAQRLPFGLPTKSSLRFVLSWETDATDVDLIVDGKGRLLEDMADGYGPEAFVADDPKATYKLAVHYANKGPMGVGMGTVQIIRHDGNGGVIVDARPFAIQNDNAKVELGTVAAR